MTKIQKEVSMVDGRFQSFINNAWIPKRINNDLEFLRRVFEDLEHSARILLGNELDYERDVVVVYGNTRDLLTWFIEKYLKFKGNDILFHVIDPDEVVYYMEDHDQWRWLPGRDARYLVKINYQR